MSERPQGANGLSIAGFILSLVLFLVPLGSIWLTVVLVIVAFAMCIIGRSQCVQEGRSTGLATAGIVLVSLDVVLGIVLYAILGSTVSALFSMLN